MSVLKGLERSDVYLTDYVSKKQWNVSGSSLGDLDIKLIRAMSSNVVLKEFTVIDKKYQNLLNYKNFKVDWLYSYIKNDKSGISGEIAKITNISNHKIILKEEMFFRKGIRAVRLEKFELEPKESCYLFFVGGW